MRRLTEGYVPAYMAGWNECVDEYKYEANERIEALRGELSQSRDHIIEQERAIVGRDKRIAELESRVEELEDE